MRKCSKKMVSAIAPAVVVALGFMTTDVMAGSSAHHQLPHSAAHHLARGEFVHGFGNGAPVYNGVGPFVPGYRESGYAYVRGRGIPDDACDLPSSACWNDNRITGE
jgi:hypothetical protein